MELSNNAVANKYYRGANGLVHGTINGIFNTYEKDGHGNITGLINGVGTEEKQYKYTAFGEQIITPSSTDYNPFRYCGEYYDDESQSIYLRARYYKPATSRMLSEDPARFGRNWYAYCDDDPVNRIDASGLHYKWIRDIYAEQSFRFIFDTDSQGRLTVTVSRGTMSKTYTDGVDGTKIYDIVNLS